MSLDFIRENRIKVQQRLESACSNTKRNIDEIAILPVTKYHSVEKIMCLYDLGERCFAENRVQELSDKSKAFLKKGIDDVTWHPIGPLQANKVRAAVLAADTIHSVDSLKILKRIDRIAGEEKREIDVFLQLNISGEMSKSGFSIDEFEFALQESQSLEHVTVIGLMTMTPVSASAEEAENIFKSLAALRDKYRQSYEDLEELSMGMSGDFEAAVAAGSTCLRIGTAILGERDL